jgi:hypothetical protein
LGIDGVDSPRSTAEAERLSGRFRERIVFFLIGGLLIAAATSKAAYLLTNPFADIHLSCSCLSIADDLAARELPARGHTLLPIWITPPQTGKLHQRLTIFLEHPERFRIDVEVVGFVKRGD